MTDLEKVIKGLEKCKRCECDDCTEKGASQAPWDCPVYDDFVDSAIALLKEQEELLKEQEEQQQKWLKQIADAQMAVCPTGSETEEGFAKRTGEWNGLQMAWDILTKRR